MPERWQKIAECYHSALEREGDNRAAYLQQACAGDDALRQEVESLLALIAKWQPRSACGAPMPIVPALGEARNPCHAEQFWSTRNGLGCIRVPIERLC